MWGFPADHRVCCNVSHHWCRSFFGGTLCKSPENLECHSCAVVLLRFTDIRVADCFNLMFTRLICTTNRGYRGEPWSKMKPINDSPSLVDMTTKPLKKPIPTNCSQPDVDWCIVTPTGVSLRWFVERLKSRSQKVSLDCHGGRRENHITVLSILHDATSLLISPRL